MHVSAMNLSGIGSPSEELFILLILKKNGTYQEKEEEKQINNDHWP